MYVAKEIDRDVGGDIDVRIATSEDLEGIKSFFLRLSTADSPFFVPIPRDRQTLEQWWIGTDFQDFDRRIQSVAISQDAEMVGHGMLFVQDNMWQGLKGIATSQLIIDPEFRNQGIGEKLSIRLLKAAKERGLRKVYAHTVPENKATIAILRNVGAVLEGRLRAYVLGQDGIFHDVLVFGVELHEPNNICTTCRNMDG